jgi:N-glycosylase/DNA lyase
MFTADLKSFADFNATPSPSPKKKSSTPKRKREDQLKEEQDCLPTPPLTPGPTTLSKAALAAAAAVLKGESSDLYSEAATTSVADRVKRRRSNIK